ncbi:hypothetical protein PTKIN_Ptkin17bG0138400 [Pterospermum kingtungense]
MSFMLLSDFDSNGDSNREDEGEFFINMHVRGHLVRDPDLRYNRGTMLRFPEDPETMSFFELEKIVKNGLVYNSVDKIYFYRPGSRSFDEGLRLVWDNSSTIDMLNVWRKYKEVDLYVEHKIDMSTVLEELEGPIVLSGPPIENSQVLSLVLDSEKINVGFDQIGEQLGELGFDGAKVSLGDDGAGIASHENERAKGDGHVVVEEVRVEVERGADFVEGVVVEEVRVEVERGAEGVEGYEGSDGKKNSVQVDMNEVEGDRAKVDNERVVVEEVRVDVERGADCVEGEASDGKKNSVRVDMNKGMSHIVVEDEGAEVEGLDEGVSQVSVGEGGSARIDMEKVHDDGHELDDENEYLVRVRYQADGEGDEELEAARKKLRQYKNNPSTVKDNEKSADSLENIHLDKCVVGAGANEND